MSFRHSDFSILFYFDLWTFYQKSFRPKDCTKSIRLLGPLRTEKKSFSTCRKGPRLCDCVPNVILEIWNFRSLDISNFGLFNPVISTFKHFVPITFRTLDFSVLSFRDSDFLILCYFDLWTFHQQSFQMGNFRITLKHTIVEMLLQSMLVISQISRTNAISRCEPLGFVISRYGLSIISYFVLWTFHQQSFRPKDIMSF